MKNLRFFLFLLVFSISTQHSISQLTWTQQNTPNTSNVLFSVCFVDSNNGWACGNEAQVVWKTTDGGQTWTSYSVIGASEPNSVYFINSLVGWMADYYGTIHKTIDGGITWTQQYSNFGADNLWACFFINDQKGWVSSNVNNLYTTDGGATWISYPNPVYSTSGTSIDLEFFDENIGYTLGVFPSINWAKSTDGAITWSTNAMPIVAPIAMYSFALIGDNTIWAVGTDGTILHSLNSGSSWVAQGVGLTTEYLHGVDFFDANNGVVVGYAGTIFTTTDGGNNWILNNSTITSNLQDVKMISPTEIWAVGYNGIILKGSAQSDVEITSFAGTNTVCANKLFDVNINLKNYGLVTVTSLNFSVLDGITPVLNYNWSGSIAPGFVETINLGSISISSGTVLSIYLDGDSVTTNNDYYQTMSVFNDATVGASDPITACPGDAISLSASGGTSYYWTNATPDSTAQVQNIIATQDNNYMVVITTPNCVVLDSVIVTMSSDCKTNAFSPNNDGINDFFFIDGLISTENTVIIYDRRGDELQRIPNYDNINSYWKGEDKSGKSVTDGTYYYVLSYANSSEGVSGYVQIVK